MLVPAGREQLVRIVNAEDRSLLKWTLGSALVWGALFLGASVYRALASAASPLDHLGPIGIFGVIGFTVGGLVGPLARGIASRSRVRRRL